LALDSREFSTGNPIKESLEKRYPMEPWKTRLLIGGGLIGLLSGVLAAFLMVKRAEKADSQPQLTPADGAKIGIGVLGLVKLISDFGEPK
jgi:hypothetical protein